MEPWKTKRFDELKATGQLPSPTGVALQILRMAQSDDVGVAEVSRENAEAELFGQKDEDVGAAGRTADADADAALRSLAGRSAARDRFAKPFDPAELERGPVLNAALLAALSATSAMSGLTLGVCIRLAGL